MNDEAHNVKEQPYSNYTVHVNLGPAQLESRRVVCSALYNPKTKHIVLGPRHHHCFNQISRDDFEDYIQGFVDQYMHFMNRKEAYIVAKEKGQIINKTGCSDILFSEDIY